MPKYTNPEAGSDQSNLFAKAGLIELKLDPKLCRITNNKEWNTRF